MNLFSSLGLFTKKPIIEVKHFKDWYSNALERGVTIDVYFPPNYRKGNTYPLLLLNDGQDLPRMLFKQILETQFLHQNVPHFIAVGIHAGDDRAQEYGTARQPDYKGRGAKAAQYKSFIMNELFPFLWSNYNISDHASERWFAGFSLGGLSALDIAWSEPHTFGGAGVFSGALWWRWSEVNPSNPDADRIMHDIIITDYEKERPNQQCFWFQIGTKDEEEDRNNNGVIDAIDDTIACIEVLMSRGYDTDHIRYIEIEDGTHDPQTWGEAMPDFLRWAFWHVGGGME